MHYAYAINTNVWSIYAVVYKLGIKEHYEMVILF